MAVWSDFKQFAFKGNVVDLAVGVIIGAAFAKIVSALVADLVMPLVAMVMPTGDWRTAGIILRHAADPKNDVVLKYGDFLSAILDFLVIALVLFLVVSRIVKAAERRIDPESGKAPEVQECPFCCETLPKKATRCKSCTSQLAKA